MSRTESGDSKTNAVGREVHGRTFNTLNTDYNLPSDKAEYSRLDIQHLCNKLTLGSLFAAPDLVNDTLKAEHGADKALVDLGTGSGIWAIEMAQAFPHVHVVGLDLVPYTERTKPSNCVFVQADFLKDLNLYSNQFDLVHVRSAAHAIRDYPAFFRSVASILKPSGVLLIVDADFTLADENCHDLLPVAEGLPGHSYVVDIFADIASANAANGAPTGGNTWGEQLEMCTEFRRLGGKVVHMPLGVWHSGTDEEASRLNTIGALSQENVLAFLQAVRPLLLSFGLETEHVDHRIAKADEELRERKKRLHTQWHYFWAQKVQ